MNTGEKVGVFAAFAALLGAIGTWLHYGHDKHQDKPAPTPPVKQTLIYFVKDHSDLSDNAKEMLDGFAAMLTASPEIRQVEVQGHTDNSGQHEHNVALSTKRAQVVADYLKGKGIPPARLTVKGYGEVRPMFPNTTEESRSKNRRVQFQRADLPSV